jgi:signal transduction histidine kinase
MSRRTTALYLLSIGLFLMLQGLAIREFINRGHEAALLDATSQIAQIHEFAAASTNRTLLQTDSLLAGLPDLIGDQLSDGPFSSASQLLLRSQTNQKAVLRDLFITARDGTVLISAQASSRLPPALPTGFLEMMTNSSIAEMRISAPYRDANTGEWVVLFARISSIPSLGNVIGFAVGSLRTLAAQMSSPTSPRGLRLTLQSDDRILLREPHNEAVVGVTVSADSQTYRDLLTFENESAHDDWISISAPLLYPSFRLSADIPVELAIMTWLKNEGFFIRIALIIGVLEIMAAIGLLSYLRVRMRAQAAALESTKQLIAARTEAQQAAEARGMFIANMNHELRTPLNAVIGFSEVLKSELFGPLGNPRYQTYAADIHASGMHLLSLINDILDFSAIDMGHRQLTLGPVSVAFALQSSLRLLTPQILARSVEIRTVGLKPSDYIKADGRAIQQVLLNLLSNAIKFSPPSSVIEIGVEPNRQTGMMEIAVMDQGPGIADADIDRLGEQFFRTEAAMTGAIGGAGLGLSIAMSLLRMMDGALAIRSVLGHGSTMTIQIPLSVAPIEADTPATSGAR